MSMSSSGHFLIRVPCLSLLCIFEKNAISIKDIKFHIKDFKADITNMYEKLK